MLWQAVAAVWQRVERLPERPLRSDDLNGRKVLIDEIASRSVLNEFIGLLSTSN
jgi:hypothetical protein